MRYAILLTFLFSTEVLAQNHDAKIRQMFDELALRGVDTDKELMYHYLFKDGDSTKLVRLSLELFVKNYKYIGIEKNDMMKYILTVEKTEKHTSQSMILREKELILLTKRFAVQEFEGFDISTLEDEETHFENFREKVAQSDSAKLFQWGKELSNNLMYAEATIVFERCIALKIKPDSSYFYRGSAYYELDDFDNAITNLEQANVVNTSFFGASLSLGHIYRKVGKQQAAINTYKKAVDISPNDDRALYALAYVLAEKGERPQAIEFCEKALAANPNNTYAKNLLKNLR